MLRLRGRHLHKIDAEDATAALEGEAVDAAAAAAEATRTETTTATMIRTRATQAAAAGTARLRAVTRWDPERTTATSASPHVKSCAADV